MNDLIQRIVNAQIRMEGASATATNPLNLRAAPWLTDPVIEHGFWKPATRAEGLAGGAHQVALNIARGYSLAKHIAAFAPPSDGNNTLLYIENVANWANIPDPTVPLWTYID